MNKFCRYSLIVLSTYICAPLLQAMNVIKLYDTLLWPYYSAEKKVQLYGVGYGGIYTRQFNNQCGVKNPLHIWDNVSKAGQEITTENGLAMLKGYDFDTAIGQKSAQVDASDNSRRGHLNFDATFKIIAGGGIAGRFFFHDTWSIGAYLPTYVMRLSDVKYTDLTGLVTDEDIRTREFLTDCSVLPYETKRLGNLDIGGWQRDGVGDLVVQVEWYSDFIQQKPILRNVRLNWRLGVGFPTGRRVDENKLMAISFGHDGAWFLPFGIGLDFTVGHWLRTGFDIQLAHVFGNTRKRRIKTYPTQTELLLLTAVDVYKDAGLEQQFNLYVEFLIKRFALKCGYQYQKQGDDIFSFAGDRFSQDVVNSMVKLHDRTMQAVFLIGWYDITHYNSSYAQTQIGLFSYIPVNGRNSFMQQTVGLSFVVNF